MKRRFFIPAFAALALCGCQTENAFFEGAKSDDEISFRAHTPALTRAAESYCANNLPDNFLVWAMTSADSPDPSLIYFREKLVERQGDTYGFANGAPFWPQEGGLDFFAYRSDEGSFNRSVHYPAFQEYRIKDEVEEQLDLLYSVKRGAKHDDGTVNLNFRHALSQVVFRAKATNPNIEVTVSDISIAGKIYNQGDFTFPSTTDTETNWLDESHTDEDDCNIYPDETGLGAWSNYKTTADFPGRYTAKTNSVAITSDSGTIPLTQSPSEHGRTGWENVMTLLPQKQAAATPSQNDANPTGTWLEVNCTITNRTDCDEDQKIMVHEGKVCIPVEVDWKQGVRYVYTLNFGSDKTTAIGDYYPIELTCSVDDFLPYEEPAVYDGTITVNFWDNAGTVCFKTIDMVKSLENKTITLPSTAPKELIGEVKNLCGWSTVPNRAEPEYGINMPFPVDYSKQEINLYMNLGYVYTINFWEWVEDGSEGPGGHYEKSTAVPTQYVGSSQPAITYYLPAEIINTLPDNKPATYGKTYRIPSWDPNTANPQFEYDWGGYPVIEWNSIAFAGWTTKSNLGSIPNAFYISSDGATLDLYSSWAYAFPIFVNLFHYNALFSRFVQYEYNSLEHYYDYSGDWGKHTHLGAGCWWPIIPSNIWRGGNVLGFAYENPGGGADHTIDDCDIRYGEPLRIPHVTGDDLLCLHVVFGF